MVGDLTSSYLHKQLMKHLFFEGITRSLERNKLMI